MCMTKPVHEFPSKAGYRRHSTSQVVDSSSFVIVRVGLVTAAHAPRIGIDGSEGVGIAVALVDDDSLREVEVLEVGEHLVLSGTSNRANGPVGGYRGTVGAGPGQEGGAGVKDTHGVGSRAVEADGDGIRGNPSKPGVVERSINLINVHLKGLPADLHTVSRDSQPPAIECRSKGTYRVHLGIIVHKEGRKRSVIALSERSGDDPATLQPDGVVGQRARSGLGEAKLRRIVAIIVDLEVEEHGILSQRPELLHLAILWGGQLGVARGDSRGDGAKKAEDSGGPHCEWNVKRLEGT